MGMKGVKRSLTGGFVRCLGCRMYLELGEAKKVAGKDLDDWGVFRCRKSGCQASEVEIEIENVVGSEMTVSGKEDRRETSVRKEVSTVGRNELKVSREGGDPIVSFRRALVVGSSLVRNVDRAFCEGDRLNRTVACFPGAKIEDIEARIDGMTRTRAGENMVVVVQIGTNNLERDSFEVIRRKYEKLFVHFRGRDNVRLVVSALLPRGGNSGLGFKIREVNRWLEYYCRMQGFRFLSEWDRFYGDRSMYKRDLLHLSGKGAWTLGKDFERVVCELQGEIVGSRRPLN